MRKSKAAKAFSGVPITEGLTVGGNADALLSANRPVGQIGQTKKGKHMKKQMIPVRILGPVLVALLLGSCGPFADPIAGGYSSVAVTDPNVVAAANFAIQEEQKSIRENKETPSAELSLVSILDAESQVVAGANYRLQLKVELDGGYRKAEAVVWWQGWRQPDPYQLTSWSWQ